MADRSDDLDLKLAQSVGFGLTVEAACELSGCSTATYYNRTAKRPEFFEKWRSFAEILKNRVLAVEIAKLKASAKAEERITDRLDRALAITDRALAKLETLGDDASLKELLEGHKVLTTWVADFAASRAPKRIAHEGSVVHEHRMIADETVSRLTGFMEKYKALLPPVDTLEGEVVQ